MEEMFANESVFSCSRHCGRDVLLCNVRNTVTISVFSIFASTEGMKKASQDNGCRVRYYQSQVFLNLHCFMLYSVIESDTYDFRLMQENKVLRTEVKRYGLLLADL